MEEAFMTLFSPTGLRKSLEDDAKDRSQHRPAEVDGGGFEGGRKEQETSVEGGQAGCCGEKKKIIDEFADV